MKKKSKEQEVQELIDITKKTRKDLEITKNEFPPVTKFGKWIVKKLDQWFTKKETEAYKIVEEYCLENPNNNLKL